MDSYVSNKLVTATPMSKQDYSRHQGWVLPIEDQGEELGFLVEDPKGISNHKEHSGRIHWLSYPEFLSDHLLLGDIKNAPAYQQRVIAELAQLEEKLKALQKYTKTDQFLLLQYKDRELLQEQCRVMSRYAAILDERIQRFK